MMSNNNNDRKINIELSHLDKTTESTLTYFFNSNLCQYGKLSPSEYNTDLYVVDFFNIVNTNFLNDLKNNNRYAIVLYQNGDLIEESEKILLLKKPLDSLKLNTLVKTTYKQIYSNDKSLQIESSNTVKELPKDKLVNDTQHTQLFNAVQNDNSNNKINQLEKQDIHLRFKAQKFVGSNKDIDANDTHNEKVFLTEKKYIYFYLHKARKMALSNKSDMHIKTFSGDIYYDRKNDIFVHNLKPNKLKFIQTAPLSEKTKLLYINDINVIESKYLQTINSNEFIWNSAIVASKGRIPSELDINMSVKMNSWPNYSKLQIFRYAIQISAVWSKNKLSLIQTAKLLKIPQRYVFTLFCAMHSLGYASIENNNTETKHPIISNKNNNSSLFNKILSHIFKN